MNILRKCFSIKSEIKSLNTYNIITATENLFNDYKLLKPYYYLYFAHNKTKKQNSFK